MAEATAKRAVRRKPRSAGAKPARPKRQQSPASAAAAGQATRPKRSKKTLGDDFVAALREDFRAHGAGVIAKVRADKPDQYLKIVLSVLPGPTDPNAITDSLDALSDEEIRVRIRALEAVVRPFLADGISGAAEGDRPQAAH